MPQIRVNCRVHINGRPVEGAIVTAQLVRPTSAVAADMAVPSNHADQAETDASGFAFLDLYQGSTFSQGDGKYALEVKHCGKVIWTQNAIMPDLASIDLPILSS